MTLAVIEILIDKKTTDKNTKIYASFKVNQHAKGLSVVRFNIDLMITKLFIIFVKKCSKAKNRFDREDRFFQRRQEDIEDNYYFCSSCLKS
ncbi:hypothetical protein BpHYR1_009727 [Brachionus plicatilis]|uniref:Uncharacterized protein n=1 Tax=Brachionus plicatilis TaxID=10195 RepID=A0A3M7R3N7_BRAPC|nr:hypothetical protein BpHYR1_009727 [Brachionus plicatilis]